MYKDFVDSIQQYVGHIQLNARVIAQVDCLVSFGLISFANDYCKPLVDDTKTLALVGCRHPVIEHHCRMENRTYQTT